MNFKTMVQTDVPQGRNGKHKMIVTRILSDLDQVEKGIDQSARGSVGWKQGESAVGVEPRNSQSRKERCYRYRRQLPIHME